MKYTQFNLNSFLKHLPWHVKARKLHISYRTLLRWRVSGEVPYYFILSSLWQFRCLQDVIKNNPYSKAIDEIPYPKCDVEYLKAIALNGRIKKERISDVTGISKRQLDRILRGMSESDVRWRSIEGAMWKILQGENTSIEALKDELLEIVKNVYDK